MHRWVDATHAENHRDYRRPVPYLGWPDRYQREGMIWHAAITWRHRFAAAVAQRPLVPWPAWWGQAILCIHQHEAPWVGGVQTWDGWAGGLGMISSPASYGSSIVSWARPALGRLVAAHGNRWAPWPPVDQERVAWWLYLAHSWSPWTSRSRCGL